MIKRGSLNERVLELKSQSLLRKVGRRGRAHIIGEVSWPIQSCQLESHKRLLLAEAYVKRPAIALAPV